MVSSLVTCLLHACSSAWVGRGRGGQQVSGPVNLSREGVNSPFLLLPEFLFSLCLSVPHKLWSAMTEVQCCLDCLNNVLRTWADARLEPVAILSDLAVN